MSVLIEVFGKSLVCILTVGTLGCGCLFPSTFTRPTTLYADMYEAEDLRYAGKYREALAKYEQALKKVPCFPGNTVVIHVSFSTFLKYYIAFCYTKLAEEEGDISLYVKAEAAAQQSYQTAILPSDQADALYLWGYILYKQERYEEARVKFEALLETLQQKKFGADITRYQKKFGTRYQKKFGADLTVDTLFGLGKSLMALGDKAAARRVFAQLLERMKADNYPYDYYTVQGLYSLGKMYLELGDKAAARRVFTQVLERIEIELQDDFVPLESGILYEQTLYGLGKIYLALGDNADSRRAFVQLLKHFPDSSYKPEVKRLLEE